MRSLVMAVAMLGACRLHFDRLGEPMDGGPDPGVACSADGECPSPLVCVDAVCVSCPESCTSCNRSENICTIDCALKDRCADEVVCPAGWNCHVLCEGGAYCPRGVTCPDGETSCSISCVGGGACLGPVRCGAGRCDVTCEGGGACSDVRCGTGPCNITCEGGGACDTVQCGPACACDVQCSFTSCADLVCTPGACSVSDGCSSLANGCNTCS